MRGEPRKDAEKDGCLGVMLRGLRHPLRMLVMGVAVYAFIADIALGPGVAGALLAAAVGVVAGEVLGRGKLKLWAILAGLAAFSGAGLVLSEAIGHFEFLVRFFGTGGALKTIGFLTYGAVALFLVGGMRAAAKRHPAALTLELGFVVLAVASALASHRHGVIARPLWLSDFAWRRGMDPADLLVTMGVAAALASASLLLFERKGKLSLAALPLLPLLAILGVSCLDVTGAGPELGETSPDTTDEEGDAPIPDGEEGDSPNGADGDRDGGAGDRDPGQRDGGAGESGQRDGGAGESGQQDGGAGGSRDGGGGGGLDGGTGGGGGDGGTDGGAGGGGGDGGTGGGGSMDGSMGPLPDAGTSGGGWSGWDAGLDDLELPPPTESEGEGQSDGQSAQEPDLTDAPPPTGAQSAAPAAVVLFENDYSPPSETYYFRQEVWSHFNGSRLVPSPLPEADREVVDRFPTVGRMEVGAPPPEAGRAAVGATVALLVEHEVPFALESPEWFRDARNPNPQRFRRAYRFFSRAQSAEYAALFGRRAGNPQWSEELRQLYLQPHPDPRFEEFALEVVNEMPPARRTDPFARAVAIKLRLDSMLTYSTRERHANAADPTVDFFFGNRIGYCVHFAHTAVYLFRSVGVPARIGVGYATPEANRQGGSALLVRTGDAHAWPELYLEGIGWVVLDIAAAENLDPARPPQDEDLQRLLGEMAREEPADPEDELEDDDERDVLPPASVLGEAMLGLFLAVLALILLALYLMKGWRRLAPRFAGPAKLPRLHYRLSLDRLAEVGLAREFGETREQFAKRVEGLCPSFGEATELLLAHRLGWPGTAPDPEAWTRVTRAVKSELKGGTERWRRWLGVLHPASFFDSR